jgi:hypothetical protein
MYFCEIFPCYVIKPKKKDGKKNFLASLLFFEKIGFERKKNKKNCVRLYLSHIL